MLPLLLALLLQDAPPEKVAKIIAEIDPQRASSTVQKLVGFKSRYVGSDQKSDTEGVGAAGRWIKSEFDKIAKTAKLECKVDFHEFAIGKIEARSVYLWLKGKKYPKRVVVMGAHYDSVNHEERAKDPNCSAPGADDNASGTAGVMELARAFAPFEFDIGIIFIAFSGEELGLLGAKAFVKHLKEEGLEVLGMVNNDIIGASRASDGSRKPKEIRCFSAPPEDSACRRMARWAKFVGESCNKDMTINIQDRLDRPKRSGDHQAFSDAGMTSIRLMEELEDLDRQHNRRDTAETLDFDYLARVARVDASIVAALADSLPPPTLKGLEWKPVEGARGYLVFIRTSNDKFETRRADKPSIELHQPGAKICVSSINAAGQPGLPSEEFELK